jgi:hypothetical protein
MKNLGLFSLLIASQLFISCKKDQSDSSLDKKLTEEVVVSVQCYRALYEKDSVELKINILKEGKISGDMVMKVYNMPIKNGTIAGEFRGDTLFVDYSFIEGKNEKTTFKNPMAMLKKGNELNLGSGKIETYLGKSYFVKGTPIEFEKVKYKFTEVDCLK